MDFGGQNKAHHTVNMAKSLPDPEGHTGPCMYGQLTHMINSRSQNLVIWGPVSTDGAGPQYRSQQRLDKAALIHNNTEREFYVSEPITSQICSGPWERELPRVAAL